MEVTDKVVRDIAELAQFEVSDDDLEVLARGMRSILELAEQMQAVDTDGIEPVSNPLDATQRLRSDVVTEVDQRERFQAIAPQTEDGLYLVPRVVE